MGDRELLLQVPNADAQLLLLAGALLEPGAQDRHDARLARRRVRRCHLAGLGTLIS